MAGVANPIVTQFDTWPVRRQSLIVTAQFRTHSTVITSTDVVVPSS